MPLAHLCYPGAHFPHCSQLVTLKVAATLVKFAMLPPMMRILPGLGVKNKVNVRDVQDLSLAPETQLSMFRLLRANMLLLEGARGASRMISLDTH